MNIVKTQEGNKLTIALEGRLDTMTAPELDQELRSSLEGIQELVVDMAQLEYVSSAGLRVLLSAQKVMNKQGETVVRNVSEQIMEVFEVTGFTDILNIQ